MYIHVFFNTVRDFSKPHERFVLEIEASTLSVAMSIKVLLHVYDKNERL